MSGDFRVFPIPPLWLVAFLAASVWYRRFRGKPVFPRIPADARFGENGCSGRSLQGLGPRIGGAYNCLLAIVQGGRLIVTPRFPFNLMFLPEMYGLDRDVPIAWVTAIRPGTTFFRSVLRIEFGHRGMAPVELVVHDEDGLVNAIGRQAVRPGSRSIKAPSGPKKVRRFPIGYG